MSILSVRPIPTRKWKEPDKERWELVVERDKNRKKSQQQVDERIHYIWFHYLKLCLNLEGIEHSIEKKGRGGKVISKIKVKVSKSKEGTSPSLIIYLPFYSFDKPLSK